MTGIFAWIAVLFVIYVPVRLLISKLVHDFNVDWTLFTYGMVASVAVVTGMLSFANGLYDRKEKPAFRRAAAFIAVALVCLILTACWKTYLYELWAGGFSHADFSPEFDLAPTNFNEVGSKPYSWLVYPLFLVALCAYSCFILGLWGFFRVLFPSLGRFHSMATFR